ncbi:MAG: hypothetical protein Q7U73_10435 [Rubrivivax sp.]|nr:hypothetical protein [Rubrivivax sp.]
MMRFAFSPPGRVAAVLLLGVAGLVAAAGSASAADAPGSAAVLFRDADLALGDKLVREHKCSECHARKVGGDGASIYRPQGRVNTPAVLRGMVEQCNLELNLAFFPDEVTSISAVLNRDHYRFK